MKYGLKLHPAEINDQDWRQYYGDPPRLFARARELGLAFVEFVLTEDMDPALVARLGRQAWEEGLGASIHPYLYGPLAAEIFRPNAAEGFEPMFRLAGDLAALTGRAVPLVFHGGNALCRPHCRSIPQATAGTGEFLLWAGRRAEGTGARVLCETQMPAFPPEDQRLARIGDTYESCLALIDGAGVDLCWDLGHTYGSVCIGKHAEFPPAPFLARVAHVHAHSTVRAGTGVQDHVPLGDGISPWREYFRLLARRGYDGYILFEVSLKPLAGYEGLSAMTGYGVREINAIFARRGVANNPG